MQQNYGQVKMTEETLHQSPKIHKNRLVIFVSTSIAIALVLVVISMVLYVSSGAIQLDASRPGVQAVTDQVDQSGSFISFPATGTVDAKTLDQFRKLYDEQVKTVTARDAFNATVLSDSALGIDAPAVDQ